MLLDLVLVRLASEDIVKRELRLDALPLEIRWEAHSDTVAEGVAMIELNIALDVVELGLT